MKTLLIAFILILGVYAQAQHTVTLTSGRIINGKILAVTEKEIVIEQDSATKYNCPLPQVSSYYDGTTLRKPNGEISKTYNESYSTAGDELVKASKTYYAGFIVTFVGLTGALVGQQVYKADENDTEDILLWKSETRSTFALVGYGIAAVGMIINITAFSHIGKAGHKLNATVNGNGVGLSMNF